MKLHNKSKVISTLRPGLCRDKLRGVFLANHLVSTDNIKLATTKRQNTYKRVQTQTNVNTKSGPNKQQNYTLKKPVLTEKTDRAWFRRLL